MTHPLLHLRILLPFLYNCTIVPFAGHNSVTSRHFCRYHNFCLIMNIDTLFQYQYVAGSICLAEYIQADLHQIVTAVLLAIALQI